MAPTNQVGPATATNSPGPVALRSKPQRAWHRTRPLGYVPASLEAVPPRRHPTEGSTMSTTVTQGAQLDDMVTITVTDEQARYMRRILLELPWDSVCMPEPQTREDVEGLVADVSNLQDRLNRLGWEDKGEPRTYTGTIQELAEIGCSLVSRLEGVDRYYPAERAIEEARWRLHEMDNREVAAGRAILEQLPLGPYNPDTDDEHDRPA